MKAATPVFLLCPSCLKLYRVPAIKPGNVYRCKIDRQALTPVDAPAKTTLKPRRRGRRAVAVAAGILAAAGLATAVLWPGKPAPEAPAIAAAPAATDTFETELRPLLRKHCYECHGPRSEQVNLREAASTDDILKKRELWTQVLTRLHLREMPPADADPLALAEREKMTAWLEKRLNTFEYSGPPDPGHVTMRRLNRTEYRNTVRDLLGIVFDTDRDFPADDVGYGFDTIGDVLALPPMLMEKYLAAARQIADRTLITADDRKPASRSIRAAEMQVTPGGLPQGDAICFTSESEASRRVSVERAGQYLLRAHAYADQAGPDLPRMELRVEKGEVGKFDVAAKSGNPQSYETKVMLQPGRHKFSVAFMNDYYEPNHADKKMRGDRNLYLVKMELVGPLEDLPADRAEAHQRFVGDQKDVRPIVERFAARAFRRPVKPAEVDRYVKLYEMALAQGDAHDAALKLPLQAILVSPNFLFRVEERTGQIRALGDFELASRLSYFLWSSMPDEELFARAREGKLKDSKELAAQARRMLKDPRAAAFAATFTPQWLEIRRLDGVMPDARAFPKFDADLRRSMQRETVLFFDAVLRDGRSLLELFDADYTFLDERLARHYGIDDVKGPDMRRVKLTDRRRGGILTMASILTATSDPTRTSPVKRGKWVLEAVFGTPPPPPLPDAGTIERDPSAPATETLRQQMERHRQNPNCISCHQRMDPIGFGFENFDGVGAWRDTDGTLPIDASAVLPDGRAFNGPIELRRLLLERKDEIARALARRLMTYALGRGVEYYDAPALNTLHEAVKKDDYRLATLVLEIVQSYPFRNAR